MYWFPAWASPHTVWSAYPLDSTVTGVENPVEMNSSTFPLRDGLARIIRVGALGLPIAWVLVVGAISMPPKQFASLQSLEVDHCMRNIHPVVLYFTAKVIPEV